MCPIKKTDIFHLKHLPGFHSLSFILIPLSPSHNTTGLLSPDSVWCWIASKQPPLPFCCFLYSLTLFIYLILAEVHSSPGCLSLSPLWPLFLITGACSGPSALPTQPWLGPVLLTEAALTFQSSPHFCGLARFFCAASLSTSPPTSAVFASLLTVNCSAQSTGSNWD